MEIDKGIVEFMGKKFHCKVSYPEPKNPFIQWLDDHRILTVLRDDINAFLTHKISDAIVKFSDGREIKYPCSSVCIPCEDMGKPHPSISIHRNTGWGGLRVVDLKPEDWEVYTHVPCSLSWNLIRYYLGWGYTLLKDLFYIELIHRYVIMPFNMCIFNQKRANFRWNKVNNFVIKELIGLREISYTAYKQHDANMAELVYNPDKVNDLYERLALIANGTVFEDERQATIKAMLNLDKTTKGQPQKFCKKVEKLRLKYMY